MKHYILLIICCLSLQVFSQEKDKSLERSNDLVYEGNALVNTDFVGAEMEYRRAVSLKPSNAPGSYNLGNAYYKSGLYDEAMDRHIEAAENATTKAEKHKAYHNIGNALMQQQECKKAVEAFKSALRNDPTDDETRYNLALAKECANKQGEGDDGEKDQKEDDKEDQNKDDQNKDDQNKDQDNKDEGDNQDDQKNNEDGDQKDDQKDGDDKKDQNGNPNDKKDDKKDGQPKNQKQQPQQGKLSPQQVKNLLEAMNNQEKKVRDKVNAKKVPGVIIKSEKDW